MAFAGRHRKHPGLPAPKSLTPSWSCDRNGLLTDARQGFLKPLRRRRDRDRNADTRKGPNMNGATPEAAIRQRAYAIWEAEGRPQGREWSHWAQASEEILKAPMSAA